MQRAASARRRTEPKPKSRRGEGGAPAKAEILVPIEGGGSVSVQGKTALIRDAEGRTLVRFCEGTAEIVAADGDLVLRAPKGRVVLESPSEVALAVGQDKRDPQLKISEEGVELRTERLDIKTKSSRYVTDHAEVLAHRITTTATIVSQTVERAELAAGKIVERAKDVYRDVSDLSQTRAGRVRTLVGDLYALYTKRTALQSTEETSIDGSKVLLG